MRPSVTEKSLFMKSKAVEIWAQNSLFSLRQKIKVGYKFEDGNKKGRWENMTRITLLTDFHILNEISTSLTTAIPVCKR